MFNAQGGEVKAIFASSETDLSGGVINGHPSFGVTEKMKIGGWDVKAGDFNLPFTLVTDFNLGSVQLPAMGLLATRKMDDGERVARAIKQVDGKRLLYRESVDHPPYEIGESK